MSTDISTGATLAPATSPLRAVDFGHRYTKDWVLRDCSFDLRPGAVTALVGPNGAGKSTLMSAAAGLLTPTRGRIEVFGHAVNGTPAHPLLAYLAQDKPLYRRYRVADMVDIARHLNTRWDSAHATELISDAGLDPRQRVGTLSGGQRTRLAIALVLARRPDVLLLDEPLSDLDPLARLDVAQLLMTEVADTGMTVLLSSHILGEVADLCEDLLVLSGGRIALSGEIDEIVATHRMLVGPASSEADLAFVAANSIVQATHTARQTTVLVDRPLGTLPGGWVAEQPGMEEIVVAYLRRGAGRTAEEVR